MNPRYRLEVRRRDSRDAGYAVDPWVAVAYRVADEELVALQFGPTANAAVAAAMVHVREDDERTPVVIA